MFISIKRPRLISVMLLDRHVGRKPGGYNRFFKHLSLKNCSKNTDNNDDNISKRNKPVWLVYAKLPGS